MTHEELVASNAAPQVDYLAKQIAKLTKQKLAMLQSSDDEEEASSSATIRTRAQDKSGSDFKVDIPIFEGKNDPDEFLEWLKTVERVFDFKEVSDEKKVKIVALKFRKYASTWWSNTKTKRNRDEKPPVDTWQKKKTLLKKKFLPTEYVRENFARLQMLRQSLKSVKDYTREFEELLLRCNLQENEEQTFPIAAAAFFVGRPPPVAAHRRRVAPSPSLQPPSPLAQPPSSPSSAALLFHLRRKSFLADELQRRHAERWTSPPLPASFLVVELQRRQSLLIAIELPLRHCHRRPSPSPHPAAAPS
ncbi:unnamed protein product [Cuscuta campestris]|uniref:Retrotransposon gag domain-containing protein n=1 Tax=Cuscuta campestris TaxID=132261 RepID=A0A484M3H4_9ASTE|nr:unnamed protein product [Cuscuta campestris]